MKEKNYEVKKHLTQNINHAIESLDISSRENIREIRIRRNAPLSISVGGCNYFTDYNGNLTVRPTKKSIRVSSDDFEYIFERITDYSLHAKMQDIINGYITLKDKSRVAICGKAIIEQGKICGISNISSMVIRIAGEYPDVSTGLIEKIFKFGLCGIIIAGQPGSGKTTLLRDISKKLSEGYLKKSYRVAVIDERNEIGDSDDRCFDILSSYPKKEGIMTALKGLSPDIIICDELGSIDEAMEIVSGFNGGVPVITTIHAGSIEEVLQKPQLDLLIKYKTFEYLVLLKGRNNPSEILKIYKREDLEYEMDRNSNNYMLGNNVRLF